nr:hypothetical protein [Pseudomonas syringae]UVN18310.1 hypothetical protein pPsy0462c_00051 [Pseudomonas syringae]
MDINKSNEQLQNLELAEDLIDTVFALASEKLYKEAGNDPKINLSLASPDDDSE